MPHYYFNLRRNGELIADMEGCECENIEAMKREAVLSARELSAQSLREGDDADGRAFEVTDESGEIVLRMTFADVLSGKV